MIVGLFIVVFVRFAKWIMTKWRLRYFWPASNEDDGQESQLGPTEERRRSAKIRNVASAFELFFLGGVNELR